MPVYTEDRVLDSVEILFQTNAIQVRWADRVLRDGEVISFTYHRRAYVAGERALFEADVPEAAVCAGLIDWTVPPEIPPSATTEEPEVV